MTSSDPTVVSLSTPAFNNGFAKVTATALKPGTSTISTGLGTLQVIVVPQGTTPRWPDGVRLSNGDTVTDFHQPLIVTAGAAGVAPFTGASPTGTITVTSNGHELARATLSATQPAQLRAYMPVLGTVPYAVEYSGDSAFLPVSMTGSVLVRKGSATLLATLEPSALNQYTLKVLASGSPAAAPTGTVAIMNGATEVTHITLTPSNDGTSSARAILSASSVTSTLTLNYPGDTFYNAGAQQVRIVTPRRETARH
jgi:hypothetical protein